MGRKHQTGANLPAAHISEFYLFAVFSALCVQLLGLPL
jgi:hypothetical protein